MLFRGCETHTSLIEIIKKEKIKVFINLMQISDIKKRFNKDYLSSFKK